MPLSSQAESHLIETKAALESLPLLLRAIPGKAEIYGVFYLFALAGCLINAFFAIGLTR